MLTQKFGVCKTAEGDHHAGLCHAFYNQIFEMVGRIPKGNRNFVDDIGRVTQATLLGIIDMTYCLHFSIRKQDALLTPIINQFLRFLNGGHNEGMIIYDRT